MSSSVSVERIFAANSLVGFVEMRRAEIFHDPVHGLLERGVASIFETAVMICISTLVSVINAAPCATFLHARRPVRHAGQVAGADRIAHAGVGLHDVGGDAAGVEQRIMHAGVARHVLAHVVDADIHQFHGIERAAAEMRRGGGMRRAAGEDEIGAGVGERRRRRHFPETVGCQEMAMSASANAPARTMKAFAAPPSSAGQP